MKGRDIMSGRSGAYIILLKLKKIFCSLGASIYNINRNTHTLKCRNEDYQYYSKGMQCVLMHGQFPGDPMSKETPY